MNFRKFARLYNLLRIDNWIKNIVIFFPCFFGRMLLNIPLFLELISSAVIFCLMSSCVYIINDLKDAPLDRNHPLKKFRPIAAHQISAYKASSVLILLLFLTLILAFFFLNKTCIFILGVYFFLNLMYSFWLKNLILIDIFAIAVFFELRLFFGGAVAQISISHWLVLTTFFLATLIALGKRRDDMILQIGNEVRTRASVKYYTKLYLDTMITITSSLLVFIYMIYSVSDWVISNFGIYFYCSDIFVILGLSKYLHIVLVENKSGDPIRILFKDRFILACVILWILSVFCFIYLS